MRHRASTVGFSLLLLVLGTAASVRAQASVRPHLHVGTSAILSVQDGGPALFAGVGNRSLRPGIVVGGGLTVLGSEWLGAEADLLFERLHLLEEWYSDTYPHTWREHTRASYLRVPVAVVVRPLGARSFSPFLSAGPFMAVKLSESEAILTEACGDVGCHDSEGPALDRSTYGLLVGAGVSTEIATYDVRAEVRYARGMADSYVHLYRDASVQSATLLVGLTF